MDARTIDELGVGLRSRRRRAIESLGLAGATVALAAAVWSVSTPLAIALAAGAVVEIVLFLAAFVGRRTLIEQLALDPSAYALPEVEAFGSRLVEPKARARLAASIRSMLDDNAKSEGRRVVAAVYYLRGRVARYSRELEAIAAALLSPAVRVQPVSAARCRWLLTQAAESPLYNPRIPAEDLGVALRRISDGLQPAAQ